MGEEENETSLDIAFFRKKNKRKPDKDKELKNKFMLLAKVKFEYKHFYHGAKDTKNIHRESYQRITIFSAAFLMLKKYEIEGRWYAFV